MDPQGQRGVLKTSPPSYLKKTTPLMNNIDKFVALLLTPVANASINVLDPTKQTNQATSRKYNHWQKNFQSSEKWGAHLNVSLI